MVLGRDRWDHRGGNRVHLGLEGHEHARSGAFQFVQMEDVRLFPSAESIWCFGTREGLAFDIEW